MNLCILRKITATVLRKQLVQKPEASLLSKLVMGSSRRICFTTSTQSLLQVEHSQGFKNDHHGGSQNNRRANYGSTAGAAFLMSAAVIGPEGDNEKTKKSVRYKYNFIADAAEKAIPAVVHIDNRRVVMTGAGSGFIISKDGLILTNAHVIASSRKLKVKLYDGREYPGHVLVIDSRSDLALIKISGDNLPCVELADSSTVKAGEFVVAIGSPKGFNHTVTTGIISSTGRKLDQFINSDIDYIQTDAAITQGNSGGPLLNLDGEVVGINSMKVVDGLAFAIPSNYVKHFLERAQKFRVQAEARLKNLPPYIGVSVFPLTPDIVTMIRQRPDLSDLRVDYGLLVVHLDGGSPADRAGIIKDDVITEIDGNQVKSHADIANQLKDKKTVEIKLNRYGKILTTVLKPDRFATI